MCLIVQVLVNDEQLALTRVVKIIMILITVMMMVTIVTMITDSDEKY